MPAAIPKITSQEKLSSTKGVGIDFARNKSEDQAQLNALNQLLGGPGRDTDTKEVQTHLKQYLLAVEKTGCSSSTLRNYKSDINQFLDFLGDFDLSAFGNKPKLLAFAHYQRDKGLKEASIKRKLISITQFKIWLKQQGILKSEIPLSYEKNKNKDQEARKIIDPNRAPEIIVQKKPKTGSRLTLVLNLLALGLLLLGLGYFAYQQFGQAIVSMAYPNAPTPPNRVLSYQGRLTNTAQSPISIPTAMTYKLYDADTGGTQLWSSNTCTVDPDQDGIFVANLGAGAGAGSDDDDCGGTIPDSVFTENSNVWLEVTVAAETLTPRQPIRTVAYAVNAETLQGLPPAEVATEDTILMMNSAGEVVLGTTAPVIKTDPSSTGLTIESQQITIQTSAGSDGDIILSPDGTGIVDITSNLNVDGTSTLTGNTYITSPNTLIFGGTTALGESTSPTDSGAYLIGVNDEFTNSTSNNVQGVLKDLDSAVSSAGSQAWSAISVPAANLSLNHSTYTTAFDWATGTGANNLFTLTTAASSNGTGSLLNLQTGASSTVSPLRVRAGAVEALFVDDAGKVGVGNASPSEKLDVTGNIRFSGALMPNNAAGTSGYLLTSAGAGAPPTWTDPSTLGGSGTDVWSNLIAPAANLSLNHSTYTTAFDWATGTGANNLFTLTTAASSNGTGSLLNLQTGASSTVSPLRVRAGAVEALFVDDAGKVGIGIATPSDKLQVSGDLRVTGAIKDAANSAGTSGYVLTSTGSGTAWAAATSLSSGNADLLDSLDSTQFLRSDASDSYTAGTLTLDAATTLDINGNLSIADSSIVLDGASSNLAVTGDFSINSNDFFVKKSDGFVGLGNTSPTEQLDVTGNIRFSGALMPNNLPGTSGFVLTSAGAGAPPTWTDISALTAGAAIWTDAGTYLYPTSAETLGNSASAGANKIAGLYLADSSPLTLGTDNDISFSFSGSTLAVTQGANDINFDSNTLFIDGSADRVGIGTNAPDEALHVTGSIKGEKFYDNTNSAYFLDPADGTLSLKIASNAEIGGRAGIGVASPSHKLHVSTAASTTVRAARFDMTGGTTNTEYIVGQFDIAGTGAQSPTIALSSNNTVGLKLTHTDSFTRAFIDHNYASATSLAFGLRGSTHMTIRETGNVGIGTVIPATLLHVAGTSTTNVSAATLENLSSANNTTKSVSLDFRGRDTVTTQKSVAQILATPEDVNWVSAALAFHTRLSDGTPAERMRITSAGNVGIGTNGPTNKLHVLGASNDTINTTNLNVKFQGGGGNGIGFGTLATSLKSYIQSGFLPDFSAATYDLLLNPIGGNVGIGLTNPTYKLQVNGNTYLGGETSINGVTNMYGGINTSTSIELNSLGSSNRYAHIDFHGDDTWTDYALRILRDNSGQNAQSTITHRGTGNFNIHTQEAASIIFTTNNAERMRILSDGNVGINNTNPGYKLDVSGYVKADRFYGRKTALSADPAFMTSDDAGLVIQDGYLYVTGSGTSFYSQNNANFRGGISNDTAGHLTINGGSVGTTYFPNRVGIGTNAPGVPLQITSYVSIAVGAGFSGAYPNNAWATGHGAQNVNTSLLASYAVIANGIFSASDERLKEDVQTLNPAMVEDFLTNVDPVSFSWTSDGNFDTGFIAQELIRKGFGYLVTAAPNANLAGNIASDGLISPDGMQYVVKYDAIIPILAYANKGFNTQLKSLNRDLALSSTGEIVLSGSSAATYQVATPTGVTNRIAALTDLVVARIRAGYIQTKELVAERLTVTTELSAPVINTDQLNVTQDLAVGGDLVVADALEVNGLTKLAQLNAESIEAQNATFQEATISGTLTVDTIKANSIEANLISGLQERLSEQIAATLNEPTLLAQLFGSSSQQTEEYLAQIYAEMNAAGVSTTDSSSVPETTLPDLSGDLSLMADSAFINQYFQVNQSAFIQQSLKVGQTIFLGDTTSLTATAFHFSDQFSIQPSGQGRLSLMADMLVLEENGLVSINANLKVAGSVDVDGDLQVAGTLLSNLIVANNPDENIRLQLAQAITDPDTGDTTVKQQALEFVNESQAAVATMSATGDLALSGALRLAKQNEQSTNNQSAGQAVLLAGETEITIQTPSVEAGSMIYITPLNSTNNQVLYVKNKLADSAFTVAIDYALGQDVTFNWWIVQTN